ncbi:McbB family protein [Virgibacillus kimchii]
MITSKKDSKLYQVSNYIYHELPNNDLVVQSKEGIIQIQEPTLKDIIKDWDERNNSIITTEEINHLFQSEEIAAKALNFLLNYKIITEKSLPNFDIKKINLYTNNKQFERQVYALFKNDYSSKAEITSSSFAENIDVNDNDLLIVFLNPYSRKEAKKIIDSVNKAEDAVLLLSYVYNNTIYVDCLYSKSWYKPCHFCHMGHIETQLRINHNNSMTYQQMIDSLYHEDSSFRVESPLIVSDLYLLGIVIDRVVSSFILRDKDQPLYNHESLEDLNYSYAINLKTKQISSDISIHWEMCNCYE